MRARASIRTRRVTHAQSVKIVSGKGVQPLPPNRVRVTLTVRMKVFLAVATAALAAPAFALAAGPTLTMREVPLHAARTSAAATPRFNMVGLHWRGSGSVSFRTRSIAGPWSSWRTADDDRHVERSWHLGDLVWTRAASAIRLRLPGDGTR